MSMTRGLGEVRSGSIPNLSSGLNDMHKQV